VNAYAEATRVHPEGTEAHLNLGVMKQELGDLKGARESYEQALLISLDNPEILYNLASVLEQQGLTTEAEAYYRKLTAQHAASSKDAWFRLGYLRLQKGDLQDSVQAFNECVRERPDWPEAYLNLGIAHWRLGAREAAAKAFEQALQLDTTFLEALRGLAALAIEREDFEGALDLQARLIQQGEKTPEVFYNTGLLLQKTGQIDDAIRLYREAVTQREGFAEALLNLGHALQAKGNQDEARACWKQALDAKPELAQS
jgi:tetratricopeptide (TPR) repeat protein